MTSFRAALAAMLKLQIRAIHGVLREGRAVPLGLKVLCSRLRARSSAAIKSCGRVMPGLRHPDPPDRIRATHRQNKKRLVHRSNSLFLKHLSINLAQEASSTSQKALV